MKRLINFEKFNENIFSRFYNSKTNEVTLKDLLVKVNTKYNNNDNYKIAKRLGELLKLRFDINKYYPEMFYDQVIFDYLESTELSPSEKSKILSTAIADTGIENKE